MAGRRDEILRDRSGRRGSRVTDEARKLLDKGQRAVNAAVRLNDDDPDFAIARAYYVMLKLKNSLPSCDSCLSPANRPHESVGPRFAAADMTRAHADSLEVSGTSQCDKVDCEFPEGCIVRP